MRTSGAKGPFDSDPYAALKCRASTVLSLWLRRLLTLPSAHSRAFPRRVLTPKANTLPLRAVPAFRDLPKGATTQDD